MPAMTDLRLKVPGSLREKLKALVESPPKVLSDRGTVTESSVAREALLRGVNALEREAQAERGK